MQQKSELPEGWISSPLINLVLKKKGKKPSLLAEEKWTESVPYLDIKAFESGIIRQYADINSSVLTSKGDILVVWDGARCGLIGKAPVDGAIGSTLMHLSQSSLYSDYLYHFLQSNYDRINSNPRGTGIPHVEPDIFWNLEVPIPPLLEQHRIVSSIEALFASLDATNEKLDHVMEVLKKFRESVLAAACDGRLTAEWRRDNPNVEDPKEFLEKIKVEISRISKKTERYETSDDDSNFVIPETWNRLSIGGIETFIGSGITPKGGKSVYVNQGVPFIRSQNVYPKGLILDDIAYVTPEMHQKMKRTHVFPGDVLLNITGASIGRSTYVPDNFGNANVNQHVCIIRCGWWILPKYLSLFLNSDWGQSQIFKMQTGQTREGLNYTQIRNMFVSLPPLNEQQEIVRRVDALFAFADSVEAKVKAAREKTEKLRQSILAKAFSGQLVETEAEIARREGRDYETAEVLIERIKAERGKSGKKR